jgi:hypothetical protein
MTAAENGRLDARRIGSATRIAAESIDRLLAGLPSVVRSI